MILDLFEKYQPCIEKEGKIGSYVADFAFDANFEHVIIYPQFNYLFFKFIISFIVIYVY